MLGMKKLISKILILSTFALLFTQNTFAIDFKIEIRRGIMDKYRGLCDIIITEPGSEKGERWCEFGVKFKSEMSSWNGKYVSVKDKKIIKILKNPVPILEPQCDGILFIKNGKKYELLRKKHRKIILAYLEEYFNTKEG